FLRGDLDAIDGISWRPDRAEKILFTTPYHTREIYLMQDSERPLPTVQSLSDLKGPRLTLDYLANKSGFRFLELQGPAPLARYSQEDFRIGVRVGSPELLQEIQQGLDAIPQPRIDNLLQRWQEFGGTRATNTGDLPITARQQQYLSELGPLRVGFMEDYAPFSFADGGRVLGLSVDVMNRLADLTGIQVIPVRAQWPELIDMLRHGEIDILANMSYRPERENFARFTRPYHVIPNVVFTLDDTLDYTSLEDLKEYRVALGSGIYYEDTVREILGDSGIYAYDSQQSMMQALREGDVDVVITALHSGNYWIRQLGISGARIAGELKLPGMAGEDLRFGVRPSLSPLADILNQGLASITPTEEQVIENRWLGASFP
ncbi:MAG: diguanylate cyclase, partial [Marinobacter sp. T13-3]